MSSYTQRYLKCHEIDTVHTILLPRPSPEEIRRNHRSSTIENRSAVFVCPHCGLGSAYSTQEILGLWTADIPDLYQRNECFLASTEIECGGQSCAAPKLIHTIWGTGMGTWSPKVGQEKWHFDESAKCGAGDQLRL